MNYRQPKQIPSLWLLVVFGCLGSIDVRADKPSQQGAKELFFAASASAEKVEVLAIATVPENKNPNNKKRVVKPGQEKKKPVRLPDGPGAQGPGAHGPGAGNSNQWVSYPGPQPQVLGLRHWIELVGESSDQPQKVTPDRTFHTGDRIRLHFESSRDGYIKILQKNKGRYELLYPAPDRGFPDQILRAGQERALPGPDAWFRFDHQTGTESLVAILSPSSHGPGSGGTVPGDRALPSPEPEALIASLQIEARHSGAKALVIETENNNPNQIGVYAVNRQGEDVVLTIELKHEK